eukprot:COSAG01_NODE_798_length_13503_cov_8.878395_4_plen_224_part_00
MRPHASAGEERVGEGSPYAIYFVAMASPGVSHVNPMSASQEKPGDEDPGGGETVTSGEPFPPKSDGVPSFCGLLSLAFLADPTAGHMTPTHRFLFIQGVLYMLTGLLFLVVPTAVAWCLRVCRDEVAFKSCVQMSEPEVHMWRFAGFAVLVIGYFYTAGARSNTMHFIAATTFNRLITVPVGMAFILAVGGRRELCLVFGILDPMLAIATIVSLKASDKERER